MLMDALYDALNANDPEMLLLAVKKGLRQVRQSYHHPSGDGRRVVAGAATSRNLSHFPRSPPFATTLRNLSHFPCSPSFDANHCPVTTVK